MVDVSMLAAEGLNYFRVLVIEGGGIGWLLWAISVVVIALSIHYFTSIRRLNILPAAIHQQIQGLLGARKYREVIDLTGKKDDFFSCVVHAAMAEAPHGYPAMERAMEESAEERATKMLRHIEWLNLIGNVAPMLGLLGTVWGMIGAFFTIVKVGAPDPAALAGDIGIALVTTLLGLGVAIPSLSIYAVMRNRIDSLTSEAMRTSQELISGLRPGGKQ